MFLHCHGPIKALRSHTFSICLYLWLPFCPLLLLFSFLFLSIVKTFPCSAFYYPAPKYWNDNFLSVFASFGSPIHVLNSDYCNGFVKATTIVGWFVELVYFSLWLRQADFQTSRVDAQVSPLLRYEKLFWL